MRFRNRIKRLEHVRADLLVPNEANFRRHPPEQQQALQGLLEQIGFAGACLVRELPDGRYELIDGHLRADTAGRARLPCLVTDLSDDEMRLLLATYDPLSQMATTDQAKLTELLASVETDDPAVQALLTQLADLPVAPEPPTEFAEPDETTDCECPRCKYRWSGGK